MKLVSRLILFAALSLSLGARAMAAPKKFESGVISKETPGHQVAIEIDISSAKQLHLEVLDGGNGSGYDWADWINPCLVKADGKEKPLTELTWTKLTGRAQINRNQGGDPLIVDGKE